MSHWASKLLQHRRQFATSTTPKLASMASTTHPGGHHNKYAITGEYAPIYMVAGMVTVAGMIGMHTVWQQLVHSPGVFVVKSKREMFREVDDPDSVVANADKFIDHSFLRKVAHVQHDRRVLPDPSRPNPYTRPREAETLKTVGVRRN